MLKNSHLFESIPEGYIKGAFLDRIHMYIPGWEVRILKSSVFSIDYGFIVDYLSELLRELRKADYSDLLHQAIEFDGSLTTRDKTAVWKSFSGLAKLIYPDKNMTDEELTELLDFAVEGRKRVKDQLYLIDETFKNELVEFKYVIKSSGEERHPETLENQNYRAAVEEKEESSKEEEKVNKSAVKRVALKSGQYILKDNQTGVSYKKLFADYLKGATKITLQDPYIRLPYQFKNLLEFCIMLGSIKEPEDEISLEIITWNNEEYLDDSRAFFEELQESVQEIGIKLTYRLVQHHDRYIIADTGWKITLGRGLDIFEKIEGRFNVADLDQTKRKCKSCEITYMRV